MSTVPYFVQCAGVGIRNLRGYTWSHLSFLYGFHNSREGVAGKWHFS